MPDKIIAFVPCKEESSRVPSKNFRRFAYRKDGLIGIKLRQLERADVFDRIVVSTNSETVANAAVKHCSRVDIDWRDEYLCQDSTHTDELIGYVADSLVKDESDIWVWTHVTSPLFTDDDYNALVSFYAENKSETCNSVVTVTAVREFVWGGNPTKPLNYNPAVQGNWPRTQTLDPVFAVNSAAFLAPGSVYKAKRNRIDPENVAIYVCNGMSGFDIDTPADFKAAEALFESLT